MARLKNNFDIDGEVIYIGLPDRFTDKYSRRLLVIKTYKGKYQTEIPVDFVNNDMSKMDGLALGDEVIINFQVGGRGKVGEDGNKKWYPHIEGKSVQKLN